MKTKYSSLLVILALTAAPLFVKAKTLEQTYIDGVSTAPGFPVPTAVVAPVVTPSHADRIVTADCIVGVTGRPTAIHISSARPDPVLSAAVKQALSKWKFKPAEVNGTPVARMVRIPFHFLPRDQPDRFVPDFIVKAAE